MEDLASAAILAGAVANVHKVVVPSCFSYKSFIKQFLSTIFALCLQVFDQYLNFITLEDNFFILRHQSSDVISYHGWFH